MKVLILPFTLLFIAIILGILAVNSVNFVVEFLLSSTIFTALGVILMYHKAKLL